MKVKLAETAGFCGGVKRAMELVLVSAQQKQSGNMYTWGPLIHNPQVVEFLESRKITVATEYEELQAGDTVVTRSHGIPPCVRDKLKEKELNLVDATCPKVGRVHAIVLKHVRDDYQILIFGDEGHAEVNAILGYAGENGIVIKSPLDLDKIKINDKVLLISQTTKSVEQFNDVAKKLSSINENAVIINTICNATSNRQNEVIRLANEVDAIVIVGGYNSGNTKRLYELAKSTGKPSFWIETADELELEQFTKFDKIGVTAGASTPHWITAKVVEQLELTGQGFSLRKLPFIKNIAYGFVQSNLYAAGAALLLSVVTSSLLGEPIMWLCAILSMFFIFSIYTIRSGVDWQGLVLMDPSKIYFFESVRKYVLPVAYVSLLATIVISAFIGLYEAILTLLISIVSLFYIHGKRIFKPKRSLFPAIRDIAELSLWTVVVSLPVLIYRGIFDKTAVLSFFFIMAIAILRTILNSLKDIESDKILMRDSIVLFLGENISRIIAVIIVIIAVSLLGILGITKGNAKLFPIALPLIISIIHIWAFSKFVKSSTLQEILIDGSFYIMGAISLINYF